MVWKSLPNTPWMVAELITSSLMRTVLTVCPPTILVSGTRSTYTTAMFLPTFSSVWLNMRLPPEASSLMLTAGRPVCGSLIGVASTSWSPDTITRRDSRIGMRLPSGLVSRMKYRRASGGTMPDERASAAWPRSPICALYSSVAVAPMLSLASAVSCTPGSCTMMRLPPWRWMTGSLTPSASMRLRRMVMFWSTAPSAMRLASAGVAWAFSSRPLPLSGWLNCRAGKPFISRLSARSRSCGFLKRMAMPSTPRLAS